MSITKPLRLKSTTFTGTCDRYILISDKSHSIPQITIICTLLLLSMDSSKVCKNTKAVEVVSGTNPGLIYVPLLSSEILSYIKQVKMQIAQNDEWGLIQKGFCQQITEQRLHISLSKVFRVLSSEQKTFISKIRTEMAYLRSIAIPILFKRKLVILDERFICLELDTVSCDRLKQILNKLNRFVKKWGLQTYFDQPIFHVSLFRVNQGVDCEIGHKEIQEDLMVAKSQKQQGKDLQEYLQSLIQKVSLQGNKCFSSNKIHLRLAGRVHTIN